jgi:hypothetical protein
MPKPKKSPPLNIPSPLDPPGEVNTPDLGITAFTPWTVFTAALKAVPALKYGLFRF